MPYLYAMKWDVPELIEKGLWGNSSPSPDTKSVVVDENATFTVVLEAVGPKKIDVIKTVREVK